MLRSQILRWLGCAVLTGCGTAGPHQAATPIGLDEAMWSPADNLPSSERAALGRKLFFDPLLSADGAVSCASCHQPERAFSDTSAVSRGVSGRVGQRNAPALVNAGYRQVFFWDGRRSTLEDQVLDPILNPLELGLSLPELERRLRARPDYVREFRRVFGGAIVASDVARALASFVRAQRSANSAFDRYRTGEMNELTDAAAVGLRLFTGRAGCSVCHLGPLLTDDRFHNTGNGVRSGDPGRFGVTGRVEDFRAFRTASLRDVARTAPYMHDGGLGTLEEVIDFYDRGGLRNPGLDIDLRPLDLTPTEKSALLSFLQSLTGAPMIAADGP